MGKRSKVNDGGWVAAAIAADDEADFPRGGVEAKTPGFPSEERYRKQPVNKLSNGSKKLSSFPSETAGLPFGLPDEGGRRKSVHVLRYKNLAVGMKILGIIMEIRRKDMIISLPGGLRGFVPAEESIDIISSKRPPDAANTSGLLESSSGQQQDLERPVSLLKLFHVGQVVPCTIIKLDLHKSKRFKKETKRIELSLRLSHLYNGFRPDMLHEGMSIIAYVSSVEDHGYQLGVGVDSVSGFALHRDYGGDEAQKLCPGQMVFGVISVADSMQGTFILKEYRKSLFPFAVKEHEGLSIEHLVPGSLVEAWVQTVARSGLVISFLTFFSGTVDVFHLDNALPSSDWSAHYSVNQRVRARVLYIDHNKKRVGLTLNKRLVEGVQPLLQATVGEVLENAQIRRIDERTGLLLELSTKARVTAAYAHISHVSDEHVDKLEDKFKVGQLVRARVIGSRPIDGLVTVTMKKSLLEQPILKFTDVKAGLVLQGRILAVEAGGLSVNLGVGIDAFCPSGQASEFDGVPSSEKFRVGALLKFRVLVCPPLSRKITVTHKKTLVDSNLPIITCYEDALEGLVTHGWISSVGDYGCIVRFYNKVKGLAPRSELCLDSHTPISSLYSRGQVVKCRVLRASAQSRKLTISFNFSPGRVNPLLSVDVKPGSIVSGVVQEVGENGLMLGVSLPNGSTVGTMEFAHLSDSPGHVNQLKVLLKVGYTFERLLVLDVLEHSVLLSSKFSLLQAAPSLPSDISQLEAHAVIPGYVVRITTSGVFVRFLSRLTGLAVNSQVSDSFEKDPSSCYCVGQSVRAYILEVDRKAEKIKVSLKQSVCFSRDATLMEGYFIDEAKIRELDTSGHVECVNDIQFGSFVEGKVQDIKDYGVIVRLRNYEEVVGFITHYQVGSAVKVGQKVAARVLDVAKADGIVDLTLRTGHMDELEKVKRNARAAAQTLEVGEKVEAVVELVKDEYLVLSLPTYGYHIAFASTRDFNSRVLDPHHQFRPGQRVAATVCRLSAGGRDLLLLSTFSDPLVVRTKSSRKDVKYHTGALVQGKITLIESVFMYLSVDSAVQGRIHITEVKDDFQEGCPFDVFSVGEVLTARVLEKSRVSKSAGKNVILELSIKPSSISDSSGATKASCSLRPLNDFKVGNTVTAFVQEVNDEWAWLLVNRHLRGRLSVLDSSTSPAELQIFRDRFRIGQAVRCKISRVNYEHGTVDLSVRVDDSNTLSNSFTGQEDPAMQVGDVVGGRITQIFPGAGGLAVQVGAHTYGRVHVTEITDVWEDNPGEKFVVGQFVRCVVVGISDGDQGNVQVDLSLRASPTSTQSYLASLGDFTPGQEVQAYIKTVSSKGCFVTIARHVDARVLLRNLSDSFLEDPIHSFPPGKVVKGRISSVDAASGLIDVSLRTRDMPSRQVDPQDIYDQLEKLRVGEKMSGIVRRIEKFGVFISLQPSNLVGMCHVSELVDGYVEDILQLYKVGEKVLVKILKVDLTTKRVTLGMKPSYFNLEAGDEDDPLPESLLSKLERSGKEDKEHMLGVTKGQGQTEEENAARKPDRMSDNGLALSSVPSLDLFSQIRDEAVEEAGQGSEDLNPSDTKMSKDRETRLRPQLIGGGTQESAKVTNDAVLETAEDFEKLLVVSSSSSFLWIKYMAFMLSISEVEKARAIAERAIQTINFREETEKQNIWVAYLNLEYEYGPSNGDSVDRVFQRALKQCDPKSMYFKLLSLHERHEQYQRCEELLKIMLHKFKTSTKVWIKQLETTISRGVEAAGKAVFERALLSLPRHKHVGFITQAAILEFRRGSRDRARAILEGVLLHYPKRVDLWNVYLDQEIRIGEAPIVRALFERIICLDLPPKKMKVFFKRFLEYEKSTGDGARVEYVKLKARSYVESELE